MSTDSNEVLLAGADRPLGLRYRGADQRFLAKQLQANIYQPIDRTSCPTTKPGRRREARPHLTPAPCKYAVPYSMASTPWPSTSKSQAALGSEPMPANEWDLLFDQKYASKLKTCGVSVLDSPVGSAADCAAPRPRPQQP